MLAVDDLACAAGPRVLFERLAFAVPAGAWLMLTGPNGSGKTTLLRAIAGLVVPLAGRVCWDGVPRRAGDPAWHARMLYQGHAPGWKDMLSVRENLALQLALDAGAWARASAALDDAIERVGLARQRTLAFGRLSVGQRRRVGLARLAIDRRPLWLLDEPTTALDAAAQALLGELLDAHLARGGSAVLATHQPLPVARAPIALALAAGVATRAPVAERAS